MNEKDERKLKIAKGYVRVVSLIITPFFALANLFMIVYHSVGFFQNLGDVFYLQSPGQGFIEVEDFLDVVALAGFAITNLIVFVEVLILLALLVLKIVFFIKALSSKSPDNYRSFMSLSVINLLDSSISFIIYLLSMMLTMHFSGPLGDVTSNVMFAMILVYASIWPFPLAGILVSDYCKKQTHTEKGKQTEKKS